MGAVNKISEFFRGTALELRKVKWPSRTETIYLTLLVIVSVGVAIAFVVSVDWGLSKLLQVVISKAK